MLKPRYFLAELLDRLRLSETTVLFGTALIIGIGTAVGAVIFIELIDFVYRLFFEGGESAFPFLGRGLLIAVPLAGALLGGPLIAFFAREAKGHGVPEVMQAIALRGGRIRPRVVVAKVIASALCIGTGGSAGREGPIVQVGSALGSTLGQLLHLSETRIRNLVACGAAAGIAATFNAPIAGVLFSMEIILGELKLGDLGNVIISAVTASTLARVFLGDNPAFVIPQYAIKSPWEILLYALLGLLAAIFAVLFIRILYWFEDRFDEWRFPEALKPAVGAVMLGALGLLYPLALASINVPADQTSLGLPVSTHLPHVFGAGFGAIEAALLGNLSLGLLIVLAFLKPLATSFTLGSGNSGGVFAPALFTGAALGGAFGQIIESIAPGSTAGPGAFAVVGMAAVFAGAARAPFTAILIVFEMTNDYRLIVPLMAAVIVSMIVAERLHRESIYTLKLTRRGIHLQRGRDVDILQGVRVEEVMITPLTVPADLPIPLLAEEFVRTGRHGFAVVNPENKLLGVVSLRDYRQVMDREDVAQLIVSDITTQDVVTVHPDQSVGLAMQKMAPRDLSRLPVVSRSDPRELLGMVRRNDIIRAYELGVMRRNEEVESVERRRVVRDGSAQYIDVTLNEASVCNGKSVAELGLPDAAVLVAIRHGRELVIPRGNKVLHASDTLTLLCEGEQVDKVKALLSRTQDKESVSPDQQEEQTST